MFLFLGARGERVQGRGHDPKKFGNQSFNLSIVFHIDYVPSFGGGGNRVKDRGHDPKTSLGTHQTSAFLG